MQHATRETVKGDFNNQTLESNGINTRFFIRAGKYFVNTRGSDGIYNDYEVQYTFGTVPLQQYLVPFPGGRLQALPYAWDTLRQRWFNLHEELKPQADEWVHWSNGAMNWNSMCADCHSTGVEKNFDPLSDSYTTHWAEIDVACESCHGPGRQHVDLASQPGHKPGANNPLMDMLPGESSTALVDKCGRCHARRQSLTEGYHHGSDEMLDSYLPALLRNGLYHSDGQILDEVFVYGSFTQSKMYHNGVSCVNCHEPHSARLKINGNGLCAQCHDPQQFDTPRHHHHVANDGGTLQLPGASQGNQCVDCHMPGKYYMTVDFRRDHSLRVPRPDLSVEHGTPNACSGCHDDKPAHWAAQAVEDWFGAQRKPHFSDQLTATDADALIKLRWLALDQSQPAIARATAIETLAPTPALAESDLISASRDSDPLVRTTAAQAFANQPLESKKRALLPLLKDPVRSVRIAAARGLTELSRINIPKSYHADWDRAQGEFQEMLAANADFASGQLDIAHYHYQRGDFPAAEKAYLKALSIDNRFNAARMNLAQLYYLNRRFEDAIRLYREVISQEPDAPQPYYSLGLLLAEMGQYRAAAESLEAAAIRGYSPRARYNLAVLHQRNGNSAAAEENYLQVLEKDPGNVEFVQGLLSLYTQTGQMDKARALIASALQLDPDNIELQNLARQLNSPGS